MIDRQTVFEIHRLNNLGFSKRKIARKLGLDRNTVKKYPEHPEIVILPRFPKISGLRMFSGRGHAYKPEFVEVSNETTIFCPRII